MSGAASAAPSILLFSPHVEAKAMEALNILIVVHEGEGSAIEERHLTQLQAAVTRLVDCLFPMKGDYAEFAGADLQEGNDYVHPIKVAALAAVIGRTMGLPRSSLITLAMAAALMNVGYLALRRSLLAEPRRLLDGEWEQHVHTHPNQGVALLATCGLPDECLQAVAQHHERWDGSGYPGGVRGEAISLSSRILAVADSYISLRSVRPYRQAFDADEARREIVGDGGRLFDPQVVNAFEEVIERYTAVGLPERAGTAGSQVSVADATERHEAQRDSIERRDEDAHKRVRDTAEGVESHDAGARVRHFGVPASQRADEGTHGGSGSGATPRASAVAAAHTTPDGGTPEGVAVALPEPSPAARPGRRRRRLHGRRGRRTLFSATFYVVGAMRGGWGTDGALEFAHR